MTLNQSAGRVLKVLNMKFFLPISTHKLRARKKFFL